MSPSSMGSMNPPSSRCNPLLFCTPVVTCSVLHLLSPNCMDMSFENVSVIVIRCSNCDSVDAYNLMSSMYIKCDNLNSIVLLCFMLNPYLLLFSLVERGFNARQNQRGLSESPWNMPL